MEKQNTYWNKKGKYQAFLDELDEQMPDIGYTDNANMNFFITASKLYYDVYTNGGGNIMDCYADDFFQHMGPLFQVISIKRLANRDYAHAEYMMDKVWEFLKGKPMEYTPYFAWDNFSAAETSLTERTEEGWRKLSFGNKKDRDEWFVERIVWVHHKNVTDGYITENGPVKFSHDGHNLELLKTCYLENNNLAVAILEHNDGYIEPWDTLTVNLGETTDSRCAYINVNGIGNGLCTKLIELDIAYPTGKTRQSGFCLYPEMRFTETSLKQMRIDS